MNYSLFGDNTGSAVLLRNSLLYASGEITFVRNKADIGAAINIQEGSRVRLNYVHHDDKKLEYRIAGNFRGSNFCGCGI